MRRSISWVRWALVIATIASAWLTAVRLRVTTDLSTLLPDSGEAGALARWTRAFGGSDPGLVLVRGGNPADVARAAAAVAEALKRAPSVVRVIDRAPAAIALEDPTLAWAYAGPEARRRLAEIVTPAGMRDRLQETRALLLAPGLDEAAVAWLARDPLRLAQVPWESRAELPGGISAPAGAGFVADAGRARLIVVEARGSAFESDRARAFVADVET
ncbi:MAG: MMPL family transporter, partial [Polyangiaceae bacterium]